MKKTFFVAFFILLFYHSSVFSQDRLYLDSIYGIWENSKLHDTVRLKAIDDFIWDGYLFSNPDSALYYSQLMYDYSKKKDLKKYQGIALKNSASAYFQMGDYTNSLLSYKLSLIMFQKVNFPKGIVSAYSNIGQIYTILGSYDEALNYYFKALKIGDEMHDKMIVANQTLNIGVIYQEIRDYNKAIEFYNKALLVYNELDSKSSIVTCQTNIGTILNDQGELDEAEKLFMSSLDILKTINNDNHVVYCYNYIAAINLKRIAKVDSLAISAIDKQRKKDSLISVGFNYATKALEIAEKIKSNFHLSSTYDKLGELYFAKRDYVLAEKYYNKSLEIAIKIDSKSSIGSQYENLSNLYYAKGEFKKAFDFYKNFKEINDSLSSVNNSKIAFQKELEYDYEKKVTENNIRQQEEKKVTDAQLQKEKIQRFALYGGLLLTLVFSVLIFNRLKVTRNQKKIIEIQKLETEQQNKEITASIRYAKRIQAAILPSDATINTLLKDSFVVYKPKDIVAGDFYWLEELNDNIIFAAADCTGHGVPGAMVSVVCNNALNRCVREFGISDPGKILDKTREIIISEFQKSDEELQDGMDISLCTFNRIKNKLLWAGANNPLWIIRNNELIEVKPDKQPIGKYSHQKLFTTHAIDIQKDDMLYVFTDGYQDQFGGEDGKKFKVSNLKSLLLSIQDKDLEKQKEIINATFEKWRGLNEQVDDVCIIGVKV